MVATIRISLNNSSSQKDCSMYLGIKRILKIVGDCQVYCKQYFIFKVNPETSAYNRNSANPSQKSVSVSV